MNKRLLLSFKDTAEELELLEFLEEKSKFTSKSGYIKNLLFEEMKKDKLKKKVELMEKIKKELEEQEINN